MKKLKSGHLRKYLQALLQCQNRSAKPSRTANPASFIPRRRIHDHVSGFITALKKLPSDLPTTNDSTSTNPKLSLPALLKLCISSATECQNTAQNETTRAILSAQKEQLEQDLSKL